jgi:hypothetical protein
MAASNRTAHITKLHKVLKKHYSPVKPDTSRDVLETLVYGICLENVSFVAADNLYTKLRTGFFEFNEVRVSTVKELAELAADHPQPAGTVAHLKQFLQSVFETRYSWDLDDLKKQNLGKAVAVLDKLEGATPFAVGYAVQNALGGHSIPVDAAMLNLLYTAGVISEAEVSKSTAPGLERAIPKTKGSEFFSLAHQLAVDYMLSPHSTKYRNIILEVDADAKDRFPKRKSPATEKTAAEPDQEKTAKSGTSTAGKKAAVKKAAAKKTPAKKTTKKSEKKPAKKAKPKAAAKSASKTKSSGRKITKRKPR